jgi:hypothetical protein
MWAGQTNLNQGKPNVHDALPRAVFVPHLPLGYYLIVLSGLHSASPCSEYFPAKAVTNGLCRPIRHKANSLLMQILVHRRKLVALIEWWGTDI